MSQQFLHNGQWMVMETCFTCKVQHSFPKHIYDAAIQRCGSMGIWCPNGHSWVYKTQETIRCEDELRQERDRLKQQLAQKDDEIKHQCDEKEHERNRVIALKGVITRNKKRVAAGVCPCCNRTFQNLASHMATQHKGYVTEPLDDEIVVGGCSVARCESPVHSRKMCAKHYQLDYKARKKGAA